MVGVLLDTHALLWLVNGTALSDEAIAAIAEAQHNGVLFVSAISGWELAVAAQKAPGPGRPDLGGQARATLVQSGLEADWGQDRAHDAGDHFRGGGGPDDLQSKGSRRLLPDRHGAGARASSDHA